MVKLEKNQIEKSIFESSWYTSFTYRIYYCFVHPKDDEPFKKFLARIYDPAVKVRNKLFGSSTAKN